MSKVTIQQMADRVAAFIDERMAISGNNLQSRLMRAGNRLPREIREAGEVLVSATMMAQTPKLLIQVDDEAVATAYDTCIRYLKTVDPARRRRGLLLDAGARIAFALLVVGGLLVAVLYWRGFI